MTKIILYTATSIDGFIADKNGGVGWLPQPKDDNDLVEHKKFLNLVQNIFMGRRSYEQILSFGEWAWPTKTTYVFTSKKLATKNPNIFFVHERPETFMNKFYMEKPNQDVWLLGGAALNKSFSDLDLIDECIITVVPITLGEGIPLTIAFDNFSLAKIKKCADEIVQNTWFRKKPNAVMVKIPEQLRPQ